MARGPARPRRRQRDHGLRSARGERHVERDDLVDAEWVEDGERASHRLVMRLAPAADSFPVFEQYDLTRQYETMRLVRRHTDVPVPEVLWNEPDAGPLGAPFFVMRRVDGVVPPD